MNKLSSKTSLFLIELVLSIFFFIVATAICMQLFVNTYFFSLQTKEINQALLWSQNLAEPFLGNNGDYCIIKTLFGDIDCIKDFTIETDSSLLLCFDKNWNTLHNFAGSKYIIFSTFSNDKDFSYQDIYIAKSHPSLDSLTSAYEIIELLCNDDYHIYHLSVKKCLLSSKH